MDHIIADRPLRVLVFVDESNLMGAARLFNKRLDWEKITKYLAPEKLGRRLVEMVVYVGLPPANMDEFHERREGKLRFVHFLRSQCGMLVVTKDGSPRGDGPGDRQQSYKANVDVLMGIDAVDLAAQIQPDVVVLVTGDSDFAHLALVLRRRGIRVEVAAVAQTLGNELKAAASAVVDLAPLFNEFQSFRPGEQNVIGTEAVLD
jgi:uncharacterized LabA/DUF88 family protein